MNPTLTTSELAHALMHGCAHHGADWGETAAVHLLIANGTWLRRDEFAGLVTTDGVQAGSLTAWVDWSAVATAVEHSPASSGERAVLRLACHLGGELPEHPDGAWSLSDILMPLDATNLILASRAVAMAALGPDAVGPLT